VFLIDFFQDMQVPL